MPKAGLGHEYFHKSQAAMASAYLFHLCQNHPFLDGNKRVAAAAAFSFLHMNGRLLQASPEDFRDLVLAVASGQGDKPAITEFLAGNLRSL